MEYFGPGPWQGVDPFAPMKGAELHALDVVRPADARLALLGAVWGNQADLGFRITAELDAKNGGGFEPAEGGLIADDSEAIWTRLTSTRGAVVIVADNAGQELTADLLLTAHLLREGLAARVDLHLKPSPYFVSDAMPADVAAVLQAIARSGEVGAEIAGELRTAAAEDRLALHTHWFSCSPLPYSALPGDLSATWADAALVILKGDLNYRRLVGDLHWPPTTPFADAVAGIDAAVTTLRTLKSEVVAGLEAQTVATLDATDANWRTSGRYAVVQARI